MVWPNSTSKGEVRIMKKVSVVVAVLFVMLLGLVSFAQTTQCFSCKCQEDPNWLGAITEIKPNSAHATTADITIELRPGWDGMDANHCCTVLNKVVQSCVEFPIRGFYFASAITGWAWDANDDRVISEAERMSYNSTYWAEWHFLANGNLQVVIHGIPLVNGVLSGNIYLITTHGEINYFIPAAMKRCDQYATGDGYGASIIYVKFW